MRLIKIANDDTLILTLHNQQDVPPYAILSHTWGPDSDEVNLCDMVDGTGKDKPGYRKIKWCAEQARHEGLGFFWVDTCCIDRSNSAELSEAISSMFRWYSAASICYAYLEDVSTRKRSTGDATNPVWPDLFRKSRWFSRGWTLQELLAPPAVNFYSREWCRLGSKVDLSALIGNITMIPTAALQGEPLGNWGLETRLQWADRRDTTLAEDRAYCLIGILGISIPVIYGEGNNASARLRSAVAAATKDWLMQEGSTSGNTALELRPITHNVRERLLTSLRFREIDTRRATIRAVHANTCDWLLHHPAYQQWLDPAVNHSILWIRGKPGAGKSTLMKFLHTSAQKNKSSQDVVLSFFYNGRGSHLERTTDGMYRSLLYQLLQKQDDLQYVLDDVQMQLSYTACSKWTTESLQKASASALEALGQRRVQCYVDALDECDEQQITDMINHFEDLTDRATYRRTAVRFCLASRHYPAISLRNGLQIILEDETGHAQSLVTYVHDRLQAKEGKFVDEIRNEIIQRASGIFMWVVLVVDLVNKEFSKGWTSSIRRTLHEIPPMLSDLFRDMVKREQNRREDLLLCLQWILFARRPLRVPELYYAVIFGTEGTNANVMARKNNELTESSMASYLHVLLKGLAEITKSGDPTVRFIHESVRDFLLKDNGLKDLWPLEEHDIVALSHERLKRICQVYLDICCQSRLQEPDGGVSPQKQHFTDSLPFFDYASTNIFYHANQAAQVVSQDQFLTEFKSLTWVRLTDSLARLSSSRKRARMTITTQQLWCPLCIHPIAIRPQDLKRHIERSCEAIARWSALPLGKTDVQFLACAFCTETPSRVFGLKDLSALASHVAKLHSGFNKPAHDLTMQLRALLQQEPLFTEIKQALISRRRSPNSWTELNWPRAHLERLTTIAVRGRTSLEFPFGGYATAIQFASQLTQLAGIDDGPLRDSAGAIQAPVALRPWSLAILTSQELGSYPAYNAVSDNTASWLEGLELSSLAAAQPSWPAEDNLMESYSPLQVDIRTLHTVSVSGSLHALPKTTINDQPDRVSENARGSLDTPLEDETKWCYLQRPASSPSSHHWIFIDAVPRTRSRTAPLFDDGKAMHKCTNSGSAGESRSRGHGNATNSSQQSTFQTPNQPRPSQERGRRQPRGDTLRRRGGRRQQTTAPKKRFACVEHRGGNGEDDKTAACRTKHSYVSELRRHHECSDHKFFYCTNCWQTFDTSAERVYHEDDARCEFVCVDQQCIRRPGQQCSHTSNSQQSQWNQLYRMRHHNEQPPNIANVNETARDTLGVITPVTIPRSTPLSGMNDTHSSLHSLRPSSAAATSINMDRVASRSSFLDSMTSISVGSLLRCRHRSLQQLLRQLWKEVDRPNPEIHGTIRRIYKSISDRMGNTEFCTDASQQLLCDSIRDLEDHVKEVWQAIMEGERNQTTLEFLRPMSEAMLGESFHGLGGQLAQMEVPPASMQHLMSASDTVYGNGIGSHEDHGEPVPIVGLGARLSAPVAQPTLNVPKLSPHAVGGSPPSNMYCDMRLRARGFCQPPSATNSLVGHPESRQPSGSQGVAAALNPGTRFSFHQMESYYFGNLNFESNFSGDSDGFNGVYDFTGYPLTSLETQQSLQSPTMANALVLQQQPPLHLSQTGNVQMSPPGLVLGPAQGGTVAPSQEPSHFPNSFGTPSCFQSYQYDRSAQG